MEQLHQLASPDLLACRADPSQGNAAPGECCLHHHQMVIEHGARQVARYRHGEVLESLLPIEPAFVVGARMEKCLLEKIGWVLNLAKSFSM
jgi:hypothetical protein